jgi:DNA-directed RNA polymerase subunit RPC12/RpoP
MAVFDCPDCGGKVSELAPSCPHCGRPFADEIPSDPSTVQPQQAAGAKCPKCGKIVTPVVTSVGGGSCSIGSREKWTCPACKRVMHRSGCFVATIAYGDDDLVEVHLLRLFRDRYLTRSRLGRGFVWAYYRFGPYLAWVIDRVPFLRRFARSLLDRIVARIESSTPLSRDAARSDLIETRERWSSRKR